MALSARRQPPLVGRVPESDTLAQLVRRVRRGGGIAILEGEAGIGKTRLLESTIEIARERGMSVLVSRAEQFETRRPFGAIVDLVGRERLQEHLGARDLTPDMAGERQFRVAENVLQLLDELCSDGMALIAVEDLQ